MKYYYYYKWFIFIFCILSCCADGRCARILGVSVPDMKSHQNLMHKLLKELVRRGHEVTYVNSFQDAHPMKNFQEVTVTWPDAVRRSNDFFTINYKFFKTIYNILKFKKIKTVRF